MIPDAFGLAVQPIPLPPNPVLRGLVWFAQAGVLTLTQPVFALTHGLRIEVGD